MQMQKKRAKFYCRMKELVGAGTGRRVSGEGCDLRGRGLGGAGPRHAAGRGCAPKTLLGRKRHLKAREGATR